VTEISTDKRINDLLATEGKLFINNRWRAAVSGKTFSTPNPATGAVLATVADGHAEDIDAAVAAARAACAGQWSSLTPAQRSKILWRVADLIEDHGETLAELETLDNGKPKLQAQYVDVAVSADVFRYMAGRCTKLEATR
jgi:phenylacetaldehyde dehydrogenase